MRKNILILTGSLRIGGNSDLMEDAFINGAESIVNRDIPAGVIADGNPCKVIREITDADKNKYRK